MTTGRMKRRIARGFAVLLSISTLATILTLGVSVARNPFAAPWVERGSEAIALRLDRMIVAEVDQDWLDTRLEAALREEPRDWYSIDLILEVGSKENLSPNPALEAQMASARESDAAMLQRAKRCLECAWDAAGCPDLGTLTRCNLLLELTPLGDANAIRRNLQAWMSEDPVDDLEVGLAVLGLAATSLALHTGGGSLTVKAGATVLRVARDTRRLTNRFETALVKSMREIDPQWKKIPAWLLRRGGVDEVVGNPEALSQVTETLTDIGRIHHAARSPAVTLELLRYIDTPADARQLARLMEAGGAGGQRARAALAVLGKARTFRAMVRLSDEIVFAIGLMVATFVQAGLALLLVLKRGLRSAILPRA